MLVRSAGNAGQGPSSILGMASPSSASTRSVWSGGTRIASPSISTRIPSRSKVSRIIRMSDARTSLIVMSPPVTAASAEEATRPRCGRTGCGCGAAEPVDALHPHDVGADPVDVGAHGLQEPGQVLHVRLAGRVQDHRLAVASVAAAISAFSVAVTEARPGRSRTRSAAGVAHREAAAGVHLGARGP